jgi:hypothetical protein
VREDVEQLASGCGPVATEVVAAVDAALRALGCDSYVKTIYIGYTLGSDMVAAVYPNGTYTEIALALPEDPPDDRLVDASHLTWPTLPVAYRVSSQRHIVIAVGLAQSAAHLVAAGQRNKPRPPDFFRGRKEDRPRRRVR